MDRENNVTVMNTAGSSILCVIDFTEASKNALGKALNIAESFKLKLTVLYPYRLNQPLNIPDVAQWKGSIERDASENFKRMTTTLFKESHMSWEFKPEVGFLDDRIQIFTEKHNVTLVVMSSDLAYKSDGAFVDMLAKLKTPLLIVPAGQTTES
ncbi:MAG TPA: universal stress protein [Cyclobacteriaceae bacterium]|nr:universal stress protein [Cyclobacteriaceae bacterium]